MNSDELNLINTFYNDPVYSGKSLAEIFSSILSKRSPYCITDPSSTYEVFDLESNGKVLRKKSEVVEIDTFSHLDLFQYFLTYVHLNKMYQIKFHPLDCKFYKTKELYYNAFLDTKNTNIERLLFYFTSPPSYWIDNVVYEGNGLSTYNDRLIYMWGIFKSRDQNLVSRLGEAFREVYERAIDEKDFSIIEKYTILSQYPDFETFFGEIAGYLESMSHQRKTEDDRVFLPTSVPQDFPSLFSTSKILTDYYNLIMGTSIESSENNEKYDETLVEGLIEKISSISQRKIEHFLHQSKYYKFPVQQCNCGCSYIEDHKIFDIVDSAFHLLTFINLLIKNKEELKYIEYKLRLEETKLPFLYNTIQTYVYRVSRPYFYSFQKSTTELSTVYKIPDNDFIKLSRKEVVSRSVSPSVYFPTYTLSQFYACLRVYDRKNDLYDLINKIIFYWSKNKKYNFKIIDKMLNDTEIGDDMKIFSKLRQIHTKNDPHTSFDRGAQRVSDLTSFHFFDLLKITDTFKYLDFGGANGELSVSLAKHLGLSKEQVFVSDVKSWFGTENVNEYQKSITLRYLKTSILPFQDNSIDFVSAFQVFHHIKELEITLREICRVLKVGGILLIREHDCDSASTRVLIDLEHSIREVSLSMEENGVERGLEYLHEYEDEYFSKMDLTKRLKGVGFTELDMKYPLIRGTTRFYYNVFKKV